MALEQPNLFHAYVGVSQFVSYRENLAAAFDAVDKEGRRRQDTAGLATLEALGPPPWQDPRSFGRFRRIVRQYESETTGAQPAWDPAPEYASDTERAAYFAGEELSFLKFVGLRGDGMAAGIDLPALGTNFAIPVYLVQGAQDLLTRPEVTQAYFERILAPDKALVIVPDAGHDPNLTMLEAKRRVLRDRVRPRIAGR
jgi:pimeloyl-ACP methyl ester carboxylesterase